MTKVLENSTGSEEEVVETAEEVTVGTPAEGDEGETASETPESDETDAVEGAEGDEEGKEGIEAPAPGQKAAVKGSAPAFKPNLSFKAHGKTHQIPEWARGAIKDAKTEKQVKEIFEKAEGLPFVKARAESLKTQIEDMAPKYERISNYVAEVRELRDEGDYDLLLEKIGIPLPKLAAWFKQKLMLRELPEEERELYNENLQAKRQAREARRSSESSNDETYNLKVENRSLQFERVLAKPDIAEAAEQYDSSVEEEGAFFDLVVNHAVARHAQSGVDLSPQEAVDEVLVRLRKVLPRKAAPTVEAKSDDQNPAPAPTKKPATLPKVTGSNTSPTKRRPRSIEDLRKISEEKSQESNS